MAHRVEVIGSPSWGADMAAKGLHVERFHVPTPQQQPFLLRQKPPCALFFEGSRFLACHSLKQPLMMLLCSVFNDQEYQPFLVTPTERCKGKMALHISLQPGLVVPKLDRGPHAALACELRKYPLLLQNACVHATQDDLPCIYVNPDLTQRVCGVELCSRLLAVLGKVK